MRPITAAKYVHIRGMLDKAAEAAEAQHPGTTGRKYAQKIDSINELIGKSVKIASAAQKTRDRMAYREVLASQTRLASAVRRLAQDIAEEEEGEGVIDDFDFFDEGEDEELEDKKHDVAVLAEDPGLVDIIPVDDLDQALEGVEGGGFEEEARLRRIARRRLSARAAQNRRPVTRRVEAPATSKTRLAARSLLRATDRLTRSF